MHAGMVYKFQLTAKGMRRRIFDLCLFGKGGGRGRGFQFAASGWLKLKGWNGTLLVRLLFVMFLPPKSLKSFVNWEPRS